MYNIYDLFNLTLKYIGCSQGTTNQITAENENVIININGLPFINQTYVQSRFCNTSNAVLGLFQFPLTTGTTVSQCYYSSNFLTFGKNQELVDINIFFTRVIDSALINSGGLFPEPIFILDIFGIDKEDVNKNGMRL